MSAATVPATDDSFEIEVEKYKGVVVVDFWSTGCPPCRMMAPSLNELAIEMAGKVKIVKVDVDDAPDVSARFGIRALPTFVLFKDGKVVDKIVGALAKGQFKSWIEGNLPSCQL